jgi:organic radical activating enzyme
MCHRNLSYIMLEPSSACNAQCIMCGSHGSNESIYASQKNKFMSMELHSWFLDQMPVNTSILYQGFGEPLLNPKFSDMLYDSLTNIKTSCVAITTNGILFSDKILEICKQTNLPINIRFSLFGTKKTHSRLARHNHFDHILEMLTLVGRAAENNPFIKPCIECTIFDQSEEEVNDALHFYFRNVPELFEFKIKPCFDTTKPGNMPLFSLSYENNKVKINPYIDLYPQYHGPCWYIDNFVGLRSDGSALLCCIDWKGVSHIKFKPDEGTFYDTLKHHAYDLIRLSHFNDLDNENLTCHLCRHRRKDVSSTAIINETEFDDIIAETTVRDQIFFRKQQNAEENIFKFYSEKYFGKKVFLWGTGSGYHSFKHLFKNNHIVNLIDNNDVKNNAVIDGIVVKKPEDVIPDNLNIPIFICSAYRIEIAHQIRKSFPGVVKII